MPMFILSDCKLLQGKSSTKTAGIASYVAHCHVKTETKYRHRVTKMRSARKKEGRKEDGALAGHGLQEQRPSGQGGPGSVQKTSVSGQSHPEPDMVSEPTKGGSLMLPSKSRFKG